MIGQVLVLIGGSHGQQAFPDVAADGGEQRDGVGADGAVGGLCVPQAFVCFQLAQTNPCQICTFFAPGTPLSPRGKQAGGIEGVSVNRKRPLTQPALGVGEHAAHVDGAGAEVDDGARQPADAVG